MPRRAKTAFKNIVGNGKNADNQLFLIFSQCFLPFKRTKSPLNLLLTSRLNCLQFGQMHFFFLSRIEHVSLYHTKKKRKRKSLDFPKLKAILYDNINYRLNHLGLLWKSKKQCGKMVEKTLLSDLHSLHSVFNFLPYHPDFQRPRERKLSKH